MNKFLSGVTSHDATTYNGAVSHSTSGSKLLDYFSECGSYRGREQSAVDASMASIFAEDSVSAFRTVLYNRMISRRVDGFDSTETIQKGQGVRDEFYKSIKWIELNHPKLLYKNLWLIPSIGRWSDLWHYSPVTGVKCFVNPKEVYKLIKKAMKVEFHRHLLAKYLPKIRSSSNTTNDRHRTLNEWARGLCDYLGWTEREYRTFKSNPDNTAHLWQRLACDNKWDEIDFNLISGKALFNLVNSKVLDKHGLTSKYESWISNKSVANFTGYPFELYNKAKNNRNRVQTLTFNAQFEKLLENAKDDISPALLEKGVLCALDTSASMGSFSYYTQKAARNYAPIDVCVGLGIYFSSLLKGAFKDYVAMFDSTSRMLHIPGNFCEKVDQINDEVTAWGGTNFQSLIDMIVNFRKTHPEVPVSDYPQVLLVVSDMEMDHSGRETNYEAAMRKLNAIGLPNMTIIWWNVNGSGKHVPNKANDTGVVMISGFDPSIVSVVLKGTELVEDENGELRQKSAYEVMQECLNQEILTKVKA